MSGDASSSEAVAASARVEHVIVGRLARPRPRVAAVHVDAQRPWAERGPATPFAQGVYVPLSVAEARSCLRISAFTASRVEAVVTAGSVATESAKTASSYVCTLGGQGPRYPTVVSS